MMPPLLEATDLHKSYGRIAVLRQVSLHIAAGEGHVVIGPNGAGKTTLFKVLTGEVLANQGRIRFQGQDITHEPAHRRVHRGFGRTFQVARVFTQLTVRDNLRLAVEAHRRRGRILGGLLRDFSAAEAAAIEAEVETLLAEAGLQRQAGQGAGTQAYGDRKRLELAMVLAQQPSLLFLDEPTAGMSAAERQATVQLLRRVREQRRLAMLLTEHDMAVVFGLADRISVLHHGELIASGTPEAIREHARVREVYLGEEAADVHA
ncbi:MAG: ABC transporter ATP-binding protein [Burkholderiaceae bacterium]|nr:ABC transporter ATP-binding protein [Burkholderiaceae bacterium]